VLYSMLLISMRANVDKEVGSGKSGVLSLYGGKKERGPEPRPLLQATILFHLRGRLRKVD
jgi:hypothetical protein